MSLSAERGPARRTQQLNFRSKCSWIMSASTRSIDFLECSMSSPNQTDTQEIALLRHTLATVAYRAGKVLRDAPESFANCVCGDGGRTPVQSLAHMGDLYDWAFSLVSGNQVWKDSEPLPWEKEAQRFFAALKKFDDYLASGEPLYDGPGR